MIRRKIEEGFLINQILECGQSFRYRRLDTMSYEIVARDRRLRIEQKGDEVSFDCDESDFERLWRHYFDLERDYPAIMNRLRAKDKVLRLAVKSKEGLRILQQEPFEMLLTFIISQNKSMDQIKVLVERLSERFGDKRTDQYGDYCCFPKPEQLAHLSEQDYRSLKMGFRAPYLVDAVARVNDGRLDLDSLYELDSVSARNVLLEVKGIGRKVADCILLFGYGKIDVFPLDVWVRRMMRHNYFEGKDVSDRKILEFAEDYFEGLGGIAQQYLFYYGRDIGVGAK